MSDDYKVFDLVAAGMNGLFWPLVDGKPEMPGIHGSVRRDDEGYWQVDLEGWRTADGGDGPDRGYPDTLVAVLGATTVLLSDKLRSQDFGLWSGQRLHVVRIRYETVVTGPDVTTVAADGIVMAEAFFPNQLKWIPEPLPNWDWIPCPDPPNAGWRFEVPRFELSEHPIGDDFVLKVRGSYRTSWDLEQMTMPFGLALTLKSEQPTPTSRYIETFELMQDLISLCWGGRVPWRRAGQCRTGRRRSILVAAPTRDSPRPTRKPQRHAAGVPEGPGRTRRFRALARALSRLPPSNSRR